MRFFEPIKAGLVAALAATSLLLCHDGAGASPAPSHDAAFTDLAGQLAAFVPTGTVNVAVTAFRYEDTEMTTPASGVIQSELAMALEHTGKFRVITRDHIQDLMAEGKLELAKVVQSGSAEGASKIEDVDALVSGKCFPQGSSSTVYAELVWKNGGVVNRAKISLESFPVGDAAPSAPPALEKSQSNIADAKGRVRDVPHDFEVSLLVAEGRNTFQEGDTISYKVRSERACHVAVFDHQVDGSTVLLFPNQYSQDTWIPAGKTIDIPGTSKAGFEIVIGPPYGADVVQVVACTSANELHDKIRDIARNSKQSFAAIPRAQFSEYLTRGMSVVATPESGPEPAGPPAWATDYVVVSSRPRN